MREILFRAKRDKRYCAEQEWTYGVPFIDHEGDCIFKTRYSEYVVDPETVEQYTGLTDKNGKKIFEGDIVKSYNAAGKMDGIGVVHWSNLFVSWHISENQSMYSGRIAFYEVIGNIHDNPELLKEDV